jgi:hypothetical protein
MKNQGLEWMLKMEQRAAQITWEEGGGQTKKKKNQRKKTRPKTKKRAARGIVGVFTVPRTPEYRIHRLQLPVNDIQEIF